MNHKWPSRAKLSEILRFDRALCCPPYKPPVGTVENPWVTWERPATKDLVRGVVMLANGKPADKQLAWVGGFCQEEGGSGRRMDCAEGRCGQPS